jgi:hypothetical protein
VRCILFRQNLSSASFLSAGCGGKQSFTRPLCWISESKIPHFLLARGGIKCRIDERGEQPLQSLLSRQECLGLFFFLISSAVKSILRGVFFTSPWTCTRERYRLTPRSARACANVDFQLGRKETPMQSQIFVVE